MKKIILFAAVFLVVLPAQAGLSVKQGSFLSGTDVATTTKAITGVGFQPKVVLLWTSADTGASANDQSISFGVGISSTSRRAIWAGCTQSVDPALCKSYVSNALSLIVLQGATPSIVGSFDFTSQDADGFTLTVGTQFAASITIFYLALGGTDITTVGLGTQTHPTAAPPTDWSFAAAQWDGGSGFQPDFVLLFSTSATANATTTANAAMCFGITDGTNSGLISYLSTDGAANSITGTYIRGAASQTDLYAFVGSATTVIERSSFKNFNANGITLTTAEVSAARIVYALGIKGGRWHAGTYSTVTPAGNFSATDMAFTPTGLGVFGPKASAQSTSDTAAANAKMSFGATDGTTQGTAAAAGGNAVAANNNYWNALSATELYKNLAGASGADQEMGTFVSFNSNGWTGNAATTSGINFGIYFGFAANAVTYQPKHKVVIR